MNFDITLKGDQCWYEVRLLETKEGGNFIIDGKNFKLSVEGYMADSSSIQDAKIRLSQLDLNTPITLKKLYATVINTEEENLNIDSKFLSVDSIKELVKQNLSKDFTDEDKFRITSKNSLMVSINHSHYTTAVWKDKTIKKINFIQSKIEAKLDELGQYELSWDNKSLFEKVSMIASNAISLNAYSRVDQQAALHLEVKKYKIELLEAMLQGHQLEPVFDDESKIKEQKRIEEMLKVALSIEQIAFVKNILPKLDNISPLLLMISVITNSKESIRLLVEYGADPNSNYWHHPILYWACLRGANEAIEGLVEVGANPNIIEEKKENSILHKAFESQKISMESLKLLLKKAENINFRNFDGKTLLHSAVQYANNTQDLQRIDLLVTEKIGVNIQDKKGQTALHTAIERGKKSSLMIVKKLIEANCIIDILDLSSKTALHYAAEKVATENDNQMNEIIIALLEGGASVNMQDIDGKTPLHYVAEGLEKSKNAALALIKYGANLNIQDEEGNTALHTAVGAGNIELIELLLKLGADRNIRNKQGHLPGALAVHGIHTLLLNDEEKEKILTLLSKHEWT